MYEKKLTTSKLWKRPRKCAKEWKEYFLQDILSPLPSSPPFWKSDYSVIRE